MKTVSPNPQELTKISRVQKLELLPFFGKKTPCPGGRTTTEPMMFQCFKAQAPYKFPLGILRERHTYKSGHTKKRDRLLSHKHTIDS